jgi:hypothetical protein
MMRRGVILITLLIPIELEDKDILAPEMSEKEKKKQMALEL